MSGYILGLTGWFTRSHDASACIIKDGSILAMVEEERFTRKKHAYDKTPLFSTLWCLDQVGITLDDIETVAIGWDYKKLYQIAGINESKLDNLYEIFFPKKYFSYAKKPKIELVSHHLAHAASTYYLSGNDKAAILIVDGQGEDVSTTFAIGNQGKIKIIQSFDIEHSLGYFYEAVSDFIGLGLDSAGKTMGLAPYGQPLYEFKQIDLTPGGYQVNLPLKPRDSSLDQQRRVVEAWKKELSKQFGSENLVKYPFDLLYGFTRRELELKKIHKDIAASAQRTLEQTLVHLAKALVKKTGVSNICMAGGVALNCSANTLIARLPEVSNLYIPPNTSDAGVSAGAALYVGGKKANKALDTAYLGPTFNNNQIKSVLDKVKVKYKHTNSIGKDVAKLIFDGNIVSWFQGAEEIGPRALGNRSIVANPTKPGMSERVNDAKNREHWRPLAPSILEEKTSLYLEESFPSPFMLHTFNVKPQYRDKIPGVVHLDNSTRPQTVSKLTNPKYHDMIHHFEKLSGYGLVLNTSFNGSREPIVCTPTDALLSFYGNSTDYLAIGDFIVTK